VFPTLQDLFAQVAGKRYFSELDLDLAYLQLPVDDESTMVQTMNTHEGLFAITRLNFGVSSAPTLFQAFIAEQ